MPAWIVLIATGALLQITTTAEPWRLSSRPVLTVGAVHDAGPDVFGNVAGAIRLGSGAVMIADGMGVDVRLFSAGGKFLNKAGGRGDGPGEFRTILSMGRCASDSAFVYDPANARISVFAPDGEFARTIDVRNSASGGRPPYEFYCNTAGVIGYLHRSPAPPARVGPRRPDVAITVVRRDGAVVSLDTVPASERYFDGSNDFPRPLGKPTSIAIGSEAIYVGTGDYLGASNSFEVAVYSMRGQRVRTMRATLPRRQITGRHIAQYVDEQIARRGSQTDERTLRKFYSGLEYPATAPAFARLMVDPADNLWIEAYPLPGDETRVWHVYSRTGTAIGSIEMPPGFRLLEAGGDYVLGVWRNGLDVQFVQIYALIKKGK